MPVKQADLLNFKTKSQKVNAINTVREIKSLLQTSCVSTCKQIIESRFIEEQIIREIKIQIVLYSIMVPNN